MPEYVRLSQHAEQFIFRDHGKAADLILDQDARGIRKGAAWSNGDDELAHDREDSDVGDRHASFGLRLGIADRAAGKPQPNIAITQQANQLAALDHRKVPNVVT